MFNIIKWIYERGVQHERLRIKKLIAEYYLKTDNDLKDYNLYPDKNVTKQSLDLRYAVQDVLQKLTTPEYKEAFSSSAIDNDERQV